MVYLKYFQEKIAKPGWPAICEYWEEYTSADSVDPEEFKQILLFIKQNAKEYPFVAQQFGSHIEEGVALHKKLDPAAHISHEIAKLLFDLQNSNSEPLRAFALDYLEKRKDPTDASFATKLNLIGLRGVAKNGFQGALSNFDLLSHMKKDNFVLHTGRKEAAAISSVSFISKTLAIKFEDGSSMDLTFENAFSYLIPISHEHFLAKRFADPDALEAELKRDPVQSIHGLLRDLGPLTAQEIKEEIEGYLISEKEFSSWWQTTRAKLKKDTMIENPDSNRAPFVLRQRELTHEERVQIAIDQNPAIKELNLVLYQFVRDHSRSVKDKKFLESLVEKIKSILLEKELDPAERVQLLFLLVDLKDPKADELVNSLILKTSNFDRLCEDIEILANKKRVFLKIQQLIPQWQEIFTSLIFSTNQSTLRDALLEELLEINPAILQEITDKLIQTPSAYPEMIIWFFPKIMVMQGENSDANKHNFLKAFFVMLSAMEKDESRKEFVKKLSLFISSERCAYLREILKTSTKTQAEEILHLTDNCHQLPESTRQILKSLIDFYHNASNTEDSSVDTILCTEKGMNKIRDRMAYLTSTQMTENAEATRTAREHGDLKENAEYKAAKAEKHAIMTEIRTLTTEQNRAKVLSSSEIEQNVVGFGNKITLSDGTTLHILGPFESKPEEGIISYKSPLIQGQAKKKVGDTFSYDGKSLTITKIELSSHL